MPNNNDNEIRECLKRCSRWMGRMVTVCSYSDADGNPVMLDGFECLACTLRAGERAIESGNDTELLAALGEYIPWMRQLVEQGYNKGCAAPNDAPMALSQAMKIMPELADYRGGKPCQADIGRIPCPNEAMSVTDGVPACDECSGVLAEDRRAQYADDAERGVGDSGTYE